MKSHDIDDFTRKTLPRLNWNKYKDMFEYVDELEGAKAMLKFVEENLKGPDGEEFYNEFIEILDSSNEDTTTTTTPADSP